jgi:phosphatidylglycerophosphatase A
MRPIRTSPHHEFHAVTRMSTTTEPVPPEASKPRRASLIACLIATPGCLGYAPFAPGTWGSMAGVLIYWLFIRHGTPFSAVLYHRGGLLYVMPLIQLIAMVTISISAVGIWAAETMALEAGQKDPQFVVIDEVSGQLLTYILAIAPANWKYLLLGFILFRVFDIWKPFPVRQAESLPGGWGIMADDWVAGIYAALGLWIARMLGM